YVVTVIDLFSKWAEGIPIRNKEATTVARALCDVFIMRYGVPLQILSDRGKEFECSVLSELCLALGIDKIRTTAYKPTTNGAVERLHKTMNSMLAKVVSDNQKDWDERLQFVMAAYRASVHEATGFTPNFLMMGREARAPVDLLYGAPEEAEASLSYDDYADRKIQVMRDAYALVREHLGAAARRMKKRYDMRVRPNTYEVG